MTTEGFEQGEFRIRSLTSWVYLPSLLFAIGQGATIPIIALVAPGVGCVGGDGRCHRRPEGIGTLVFDVPAGILVARFGERRAMVLAAISLVLVAVGIALRPSLVVYSILVFLLGCAWSVWALARLTYVTEATPLRLRGRVMSIMGGTMRMGQFIGPLIGGFVIISWGLVGPFVVQAVLAAAASVVLAPTTEPDGPETIATLWSAHEAWSGPTSGPWDGRSGRRAIQVLRSARQ